MDSFEAESISGILDRTPKREPFYSEVGSSLNKLRQGDPSHNPLYGIIHGHIGALLEAGKLGPDWVPRTVLGGVVVPHRDFLNIQDDFASIEGGDEEKARWNAEMSIDSLGKYIGTMRSFRNRHSAFFKEALLQLPPGQEQIIQPLVEKHKNLLADPNDFIMVAIPSHFDNPKLWEQFGLSGKLLDRIGTWSKINEQGVILASRIHRNDDPRGHDYFSYAARAVKNGETKTMTEKLLLTAQHEGSHGITDALLMDILKLDAYNPIYEGLVGALGEDGRYSRSKTPFSQFLENPYPADTNTRMDSAYYDGAKFWEATRRILQKQGIGKVWPTIISSSLSTALDVKVDQSLMHGNTNTRIAVFLKRMLERLGISMRDLESEYGLTK